MADMDHIPWAQASEYLNFSRTEPQPGDLTAYDPPRCTGASPTDVTTFKAGHSRLTVDNLPNVLYMIRPTAEWREYRSLPKPPQKVDPFANQPMFEHAPRPNTTARPLLDWPVLRGIDKIGTQEDWPFFETMLRLEPRLEWADFDMRMDYVGDRANKSIKGFVDIIQQRSGRRRNRFSILSWRVRSVGAGRATQRQDRVLARLTPQQVLGNTTRGTTPGLIDPLLPDTPANRIAVPRKFSHMQQRNATNAPSFTNASCHSRKRKFATSSIKTDADELSDSSFESMANEDAETSQRFKRAKRASSNPQAIHGSSSSSSSSSPPPASTPSREPERGKGKVPRLNRNDEGARRKAERDSNISQTGIFEPPSMTHTSQGEKRKQDDHDDHSESDYDNWSSEQRQRRSLEIARRGISRKNFLEEPDLCPLCQEASEAEPEGSAVAV